MDENKRARAVDLLVADDLDNIDIVDVDLASILRDGFPGWSSATDDRLLLEIEERGLSHLLESGEPITELYPNY